MNINIINRIKVTWRLVKMCKVFRQNTRLNGFKGSGFWVQGSPVKFASPWLFTPQLNKKRTGFTG